MDKILLTLGIGSIGGFLGVKLKIPAGALIGAMFAVAVFNLFSGKGDIPQEIKLAAQVVVGCFIGLNFKPDALNEIKSLIVPALILILGLTVNCILLGWIISKVSGIDIVTALFSCAPGGLADTTLISEAYGADTPKVALLHLVRLVTVVSIFPVIIGYFLKITQK